MEQEETVETQEVNNVDQNVDESSESTEVAKQVSELESKAETGDLTKTEKKMLKQLKLKVDGREVTEDLPFEIEDDPKKVEWFKKNLQLSKVAQKRMQEQAQLQKEVEQFVNEIRKNPRKILTDPSLGVDFKKMVQEYIEEEIENSQKTPEQIENEKIKAELETLRAEKEKEKEEHKAREMERLQQQEMERYNTQIKDALSKTGLPQSPYVTHKVANYMLRALDKGIDVKAEDIVPIVEKEIQEELREMFAVAPEEVIERLVGKDALNRVRKGNLKKAPPTPIKRSVQDTGGSGKRKEEPAEKKTLKDLFGI